MTNVYESKAKQGGQCSFDEVFKKLEPKLGFEKVNGYAAKSAQAQGTIGTFWKFVSDIRESGCAPVLQCATWTYTGPNQTARQYILSDPTSTTPTQIVLDVLFSRKGGKNYDAHIRVGAESDQLRARTAEADNRLLRNVESHLFTSGQSN